MAAATSYRQWLFGVNRTIDNDNSETMKHNTDEKTAKGDTVMGGPEGGGHLLGREITAGTCPGGLGGPSSASPPI